MLTVLNWPPDRCWATDLAIEGFSATHRTLGAILGKLFSIGHEGRVLMDYGGDSDIGGVGGSCITVDGRLLTIFLS